MAGHDVQPTDVNSEQQHASETSPLLSAADRPADGLPVDPSHRRQVIFVTFAMFFFLEFGAGLLQPGLTAALEQKICGEVFPGLAPGDQHGCKAPAVQGKLALLQGWRTTIDCIPGLIATIPFGILSNKWGRHRVLSLAFSGITLGLAWLLFVLYVPAIPVDLVLLAPMFMFVGGGPAVITAMLYTTIADITTVSARAPIFLELSALLILSEVASGPLAGLVLLKSLWGLLVLAAGFYVLATATTFLLPDTRSVKVAEDFQQQQQTTGDNGDLSLRDRENGVSSSTIRESLRQAREGLVEVQAFLKGRGLVVIMMFCHVFVAISKVVQPMLLQYTTKRYDWSWSRAAFILTIRSIVSLVVLVLILPALTQFLTTRTKVSVISRDTWIARSTGLAGIIGALLIGLAPTSDVLIAGLVTFAIHGGMTPVIRSLLSNMVEARHLGTMNSFVGILEMVGLMVGAPVLFGSLQLGFELEGTWVGLPFLCAAALIALSTLIVCFLPIREAKKEGDAV